jgi:hypothetical protein
MNELLTDKSTWAAALKTYIAERREAVPIPPRDSLTEEDEWHCRVIGGELIAWHQSGLRHILMQRHALRVMEFEAKPLIVFTTSMAGLVAAQEIIPEPQGDLVYLLDEEFTQWQERHSTSEVSEFQWHIHHWSYFRAINEKLLRRARGAYSEIDASGFRLHVSGDLWGESCGAEDEHLWRWDGGEMELLEEGFSRAVF